MLKESNKDAATKEKVEKMCKEGMGLHDEGKHPESAAKLREALAELAK